MGKYLSKLVKKIKKITISSQPVISFFPSFSIPDVLQSYQPHLEVRDPIWGDGCSHSLHWWSPSWSFPGFSSAVRQMPGDLCIAPGITSLLPLSLTIRCDWRDTRGSRFWLGMRTGAAGNTTLAWSYLLQPMAPYTQKNNCNALVN